MKMVPNNGWRKWIEKMRIEIDSKFQIILQEIKENRSMSVVTNPRSEQEIPQMRASSSKTNLFGEINASQNIDRGIEDENNPFRSSEMSELRQPVEPLLTRNISHDDTIVINERPTEEDYHR